MPKTHRIAARAIIIRDARILLVNAYPDHRFQLWCAPGGGAEMHSALPDNLAREVFEETGLCVTVGNPCLINEFHDPERDFHQIDIFFRCEITGGMIRDDWEDPEAVVTQRRFFSQAELSDIRLKPDSLARVAFDPSATLLYDPLERIVG